MKITMYRQMLPATSSNKEWLAHMDMGGDIFMSFFGDSEESARNRAQSFWDTERARQSKIQTVSIPTLEGKTVSVPGFQNPKTVGVGRGQANTGKVWVMSTKTGDKKRISPDQLASYLNKGFVKAGPRTQFKG